MRVKNGVSEAFIKEYADKYVELYDKINSGNLKAIDILELQYEIFKTIEKLKTASSDDVLGSSLNFDYIIHTYRLLVNNILAVRIIGVEPVNMRKLSTSQYGNDNYNSENIESYFRHARKLIKEDGSLIIVICDLCVGNIEWGDLILKKGNEISGIEIKNYSKKNIEILDAIDSGAPISSLKNEKDKKQYERFIRQRKRMDVISSRLEESDLLLNGEGVVFPMIIPWLDNYSREFSDFICGSSEVLFQERTIDEGIKLVSINKEMEEIILAGDFAKALLLIGEQDEAFGKYFDFCQKYSNNEKKDAVDVIQCYNEVLEETFLPQPYAFGIDSKILRNFIAGEIAIFVDINIEAVFSKLRENGYKVYSKKGYTNRTEFIYKNKRWIIEHESGTKIPFSHTFITRMAYAFYSTKAIIDFIDILFQCCPRTRE